MELGILRVLRLQVVYTAEGISAVSAHFRRF